MLDFPYHFTNEFDGKPEPEQIFGMKWVAYVKAHIEGYDYYFSMDFSIPEDLYLHLWDAADHKIPISKCARYEEVLKFAQIAIDYRKLCGFDYEFYLKSELYNNEDEDNTDKNYWNYIRSHNRSRKNVNADLCYIRIFDPNLEETFKNCFLDLPVKKEYLGKTKMFSFTYYDGEEYEWTVKYPDEDPEDDPSVSKIISSVSLNDYAKFLNGNDSMYPPYEEIIEALKNNEIEYSIKEST